MATERRGKKRRLAARGLRVFAAVALLALAPTTGCRGRSPTAHTVTYELDWAWDRVDRAPDGSHWETTNDRGYHVRVTRGYLSSYSVELVECPRTAGFAPGGLAPGGLLRWFVEGAAYAGHATGTPNPAALRARWVESLLAPARRKAGSITLAPQTYCQLHYLVARAEREARGLPAELDMVDVSLHVDGTYRLGGDSAEVPFTIHTNAAYGALFDHTVSPSAPLRVDTGATAARVTVRRHPGGMFDGVDFAHMREAVVANQVLNALIDHVDVAAVHEQP